MTCDQLLDDATEAARVDRGGIELPGGIRPEQQTDQDRRQLGILGVATMTVGQAIEHRRQLGNDLAVESRDALPELRTPERGDADLGEEHAPRAVGGKLDEEEVETARECALGVEHVELGFERRAQVLDDLIDRGDQEIFLGLEVVMHEPGRQTRLGGDALDGGVGDAVLQDRGPEPFDDLTASRARETRPSHR